MRMIEVNILNTISTIAQARGIVAQKSISVVSNGQGD